MSIFGFSFHWYGALLGVAIAVGIFLIEKKRLQQKDTIITEKKFEQLVFVMLISGLFGARFWHVLTDWQLYIHNPIAVFYIWNGGISIIGAVVFAVLSSLLFFKQVAGDYWQVVWLQHLDLFVYGLPIGQAIGRLGNWVNQELYGLPTNLPWAIVIDPGKRMVGYEQFATFHPLFIYEAFFTLFFGVFVWLWKPVSRLQPGVLATLYVFYYALTRFLLDFLRIQKTAIPIFSTSLYIGSNQVFLLGCIVVCGTVLVHHWLYGSKK